MSVIDSAALEASPLADLHEIASELSLDGYRRLRRADLIDAIIVRQGGTPVPRPEKAPAKVVRSTRSRSPKTVAAAEAVDETDAPDETDEKPAKPTRTRTRSTRSRVAKTEEPEVEAVAETVAAEPEPAGAASEDREGDGEGTRRRRSRGGRGRGRAIEADGADEKPVKAASADRGSDRASERDRLEDDEDGEEQIVEGVVELLPNGSGFVRVSPPDPSDDDVYVSAAQVKRCELVSGDRISGPRRAPRRSERFASLVRIDTINGAPASELADGARFDELPAAFPQERFKLGSEDLTVKAIEWLTPIGRGSRVAIVGGARSGKTETLRRLASALVEHEDLQISVVLAGVRPEEIALWAEPLKPAAAVSFAASADSQDHTVELVVDQAKRIAGRGAHAVVLIDTLDGLHPHSARRAMAAARNISGGGSLTVIATGSAPLGGETTVIALDASLTSTGRFPAVDLLASGTLKPELLVGAAGAEAIASTRLAALDD